MEREKQREATEETRQETEMVRGEEIKEERDRHVEREEHRRQMEVNKKRAVSRRTQPGTFLWRNEKPTDLPGGTAFPVRAVGGYEFSHAK